MSFPQANRKSDRTRSIIVRVKAAKQATATVMKEMMALSVLIAGQISLLMIVGALI